MREPMRQTEQLMAEGRIAEAVQHTNALAQAGNADAICTLANWRLEGRILPRDLRISRELFRRATEAGSKIAAQIHTAFLANGTGGPPDWPQAIKQLRTLARKDSASKRQLWLVEKMNLTVDGGPAEVPPGERISDSQEISLFRSLFTDPECSYLSEAAGPLMQPSVIIDHQGRQVPNPVRTSDAANFPWARENPAVHALNRRLASISGTDVRQGEPLEVLRYRVGQQYHPHLDSVAGLDNQRQFTVLVYLTDDFEGGETHFPRLDLLVKAKRGDALLFRNCDDAGQPINDTLHAGLPVTKGVKVIASRWIRERPLEV
jgi:prolyl 4-hydroxylase